LWLQLVDFARELRLNDSFAGALVALSAITSLALMSILALFTSAQV
jgi:hypothetical protein